ncbi:hypothetical protein N9157_02125 [Saprospiraceae bacterium]|nr:hypothetical protein [Saprospiraceae bacterium]
MVKLIHKKSSVSGRIPDSSDLEYGELAVNYADGYLYYKASNNDVNRVLDSAVTEALINSKITSALIPGARGSISVTDNGGDGSLTYTEATGVITYVGPAKADVLAHLSAGGDLSFNSTTGQFSVTTYKDADFDTRLDTKSTTNVAEGSNLYYTEARVDSDFDTRLAIKTTSNLAEGSNLYYTNARADARVIAVMDSDQLDLLAKAYVTKTATQTLTNKTLTAPILQSIILRDSAGDQSTVHTHAYSGISFNTGANFGDSNHTVYHFGGDSSRDTVISLGKNDQFNHGIGVTGVQNANDFVIGFEGNATNFKIKKDVGANYDLSTGTDMFSIDSEGRVLIPSNQASTNKTSGALVITGGVGVSGDLRGSEIIASGNIQSQGNFIGNLTGQVTDISNHNTGDLSEGSNKYYLKSRADSDIDSAFDARNTGDLSEGGNLYYTTARADSDAKRSVSVTDAGGDGSLSYNNTTGVVTYQGPVAADARAHFSGGTGVTLNSSNGVISIGQDVSTSSVVTFAGGSTISGNLNVSGDLVVGGDQISNQVTDLRVTNAMIKLADSNTTDAVDIGLVGRYSDDGGSTLRRAGFIRDASNGEFYAFQGLVQDGLDSSVADQTINVNGTGWELGTWNFGALRGSYLGFDSDFSAFQSNYSVKTGNYTAVAGDRLAIDTSGGAFTVTLPSNPVTGNTIRFIDIANWNATLYLDVARNGNTIEGVADNFRLDLGQNTVDFIFINNTWNVYAAIGQRGEQGFTGAAGVNADSDTLNSNAIAYAIALG